MLFLNEYDLIQCLDLDLLQMHMKDALLSFSLKKAINPPRAVFQTGVEHDAPFGFMPAFDHNKKIMGYKAISVFHQNIHKKINPHQGIVTLLDPETGKIKCILDAFFITAVRTAAVSAVATDLLSRIDAKTLALIGAGCQAVAHVKAISRIRPIQNIRVYSRTNESFDLFCQQFKESTFNITRYSGPQETVACADVVVTCTSAKKSLLSIQDFSNGTHINAIGACRPGNKEVALFDRKQLKIYIDSFESCMIESEEIIQPLKDKSLSQETIIGELGSCIAQQIPGRENREDITFFKSIGLSIEDIYAAEFFYKQAQELNIGQKVCL